MVLDMFEHEELLKMVNGLRKFTVNKVYEYKHTAFILSCYGKQFKLVYYINGERNNHIIIASVIQDDMYGTYYGSLINNVHSLAKNIIYEMFGV